MDRSKTCSCGTPGSRQFSIQSIFAPIRPILGKQCSICVGTSFRVSPNVLPVVAMKSARPEASRFSTSSFLQGCILNLSTLLGKWMLTGSVTYDAFSIDKTMARLMFGKDFDTALNVGP